MIYKMDLKDSSDTMTFNLLETPIVDKDIEGAVDNVTLDGNQYTDYLYLKKQYIQKWAIMCPDEYDELRGFYTRQFEDGEVPSYRVYYGANVTRDYTLNGDYFQFNAEGIETGMTLSQLTGNAEQTTYSGKNLARPNGNNTAAGVSFVWNSDGTITLNGTSTAAIDVWVANGGSGATEFTIPTGTKLTQSFRVVSGSASANTWAIRTNLYYGGASHWSDVVGNTTFTATSETQVRGLEVLAPSSGLTFNNLRLEIQLEKSATATTWEKYVGGTPAPNPSYPQPISTVTGAQTVVVTGKNLFNFQEFAQDKIQAGGVIRGTATATGDSITITATGNDAYTRVDFAHGYPPTIRVKNNTDYVLSWKTNNTSGTNIGVVYVFARGSNNQNIIIGYRQDTAGNFQFNTGAYSEITFRLGVASSGNSLTYSDIQFEEGNQASEYQPYGQDYGINLGKNLLDNKATTRTYLGVTLTKNNDGSITLNGTSTGNAQFYLDVDGVGFQGRNSHLGAGTYTINGRDSGGVKFEINYQTANGSSKYSWGTFTVAEPFDYGVYVNITNGTTVNNLRIYPQLERGSQATTYAPYFPPIELAKVGNYQDRIYKSEGKWYIEKQVGKVVFDGSEAWSGANSNAYYYRTLSDAIILPSSATMPPVTSDYYTPATRNDLWASQVDYGVGLYDGAIARVSIRNKDCANSDALKTWLSTHPTTVYYALATPTTTEITDETLLLQLNFLASLYEGENNISLVGTGAQGEMEVFIRDVMSVETDVVPEVPVRLTLTDDGVINACGCRRNVQLTMRETTE